MGGWGEYALAWAAFLLSHMLPARPGLRRRLARRLGEGGYLAGYSLASVLAMAWLIAAAGRAPTVVLWGWAAWQAWVPNLVVPLACILLALGLRVPNPFSIGGAGDDRFDPARPGVLALTRHPVLWAVVLWAGAHVPPNGDLATASLFTAFAVMGLAGMRALDARRRRAWGEARWRAATRIPTPPHRALFTRGAALRAAAGLVAWLSLAALHARVIGVPPWPVAG
jgi:uncharacterized membrane protein